MGMKAGVVVLLLNILKDLSRCGSAVLLTRGNTTALGLAVAAVMLGHCYPVFVFQRR